MIHKALLVFCSALALAAVALGVVRGIQAYSPDPLNNVVPAGTGFLCGMAVAYVVFSRGLETAQGGNRAFLLVFALGAWAVFVLPQAGFFNFCNWTTPAVERALLATVLLPIMLSLKCAALPTAPAPPPLAVAAE